MSKVKQGNAAAAVCASHAAVLTFPLCGELVQAHCSTTQLLMHSIAPVGLNVCFCLEGLHAIMSVLGPTILHSLKADARVNGHEASAVNYAESWIQIHGLFNVVDHTQGSSTTPHPSVTQQRADPEKIPTLISPSASFKDSAVCIT